MKTNFETFITAAKQKGNMSLLDMKDLYKKHIKRTVSIGIVDKTKKVIIAS